MAASLTWTTGVSMADQKKMQQQSNRLQQRGQGEVKGIGGGRIQGLMGRCHVCHRSSGGGKEDGGGRGGSAPDDGAGVVGVGHHPRRSTPIGDWGRLPSTDRWQEGSGGANMLSRMVQPTDQSTMRHRVRKPEAKKYACGQSIIHGGEDRRKVLRTGTNYRCMWTGP